MFHFHFKKILESQEHSIHYFFLCPHLPILSLRRETRNHFKTCENFRMQVMSQAPKTWCWELSFIICLFWTQEILRHSSFNPHHKRVCRLSTSPDEKKWGIRKGKWLVYNHKGSKMKISDLNHVLKSPRLILVHKVVCIFIEILLYLDTILDQSHKCANLWLTK